MRCACRHAGRARVHQRFRAFHERPGSIDKVIDHNAIPSTNIADDIHHLGYIRLFTPFIDNRQRSVQAAWRRLLRAPRLPRRAIPP